MNKWKKGTTNIGENRGMIILMENPKGDTSKKK
jgi:hypothetical protein